MHPFFRLAHTAVLTFLLCIKKILLTFVKSTLWPLQPLGNV